jgi:hypothetical protein
MNVSKLTKVKIKDIWKTEDRDFTPWLVENWYLYIFLHFYKNKFMYLKIFL